MYKCAKCDRNFATPDRLKNHGILCRDKDSAEELVEALGHHAARDAMDHSPERGPAGASPVVSDHRELEPLKPV
jgi:hypothetical protein